MGTIVMIFFGQLQSSSLCFFFKLVWLGYFQTVIIHITNTSNSKNLAGKQPNYFVWTFTNIKFLVKQTLVLTEVEVRAFNLSENVFFFPQTRERERAEPKATTEVIFCIFASSATFGRARWGRRERIYNTTSIHNGYHHRRH